MKNKILIVVLIICLIISLYLLKYNVQNEDIDNNKNTNNLTESEIKTTETKEIIGTVSN